VTDLKPPVESPVNGAVAKRRSKRIHIAIPVVVRAKIADQPIEEPTTTLRVNAHGCLINLSVQPDAGQEVRLVNPVTQEEVACTVNFVAKKDATQTEVGLEFRQPSPFFWQMHFPPEDWNPEERKLPTAVGPLTAAPFRR
jgi:PilZ domain-containing protein